MAKKKQSKGKDLKQDARIKALESMVMKTIENKQDEYSNTNLGVSSSGVRDGAFLQLNQNVGDNGRIGNSITLLKQQFDIMATQNPSGVLDNWNRMRILIVESLDGSQPILISDVLQYSSYTTDSDLVFSSPYTTKTSTNRRYKVHYDKTFELNATAQGATRSLRFVKKYKNGKVVNFDDGSSPPTNHQISLLFISDSAATPHPLVNYSVRSTYKDA